MTALRRFQLARGGLSIQDTSFCLFVSQDAEKLGYPPGQAHAEVREIIGAVDDTFLERMILVCMDLPTGYLLLENVAEDRTYATWKALVEERLKALGTHVHSLLSDRAKALVQLAETGLECLSMPDFFHVVHAIVQSYSLPIGLRLRQARQELTQAQEALARRQGQRHAAQEASEAQALAEARQAEVMRGEEAHHAYWGLLESLSHTLHPFHLSDSTPQSSVQVESQLTAAVEGECRVSATLPVARPSQGHGESPNPSPSSGCAGGLLVARGPSGLGALPPRTQVATVGTREPPPPGLLGYPGASHTVPPTESQDARGLGSSAGGV